MRIVHAVLSAGFFGSERYCIELAVAQALAGHDVTVIGYDAGSECSRSFGRYIEDTWASSTPASIRPLRLLLIP